MSKKEGRIYMCDPEKNTVCEKTSCYINGGPCRRTRRAEFAKDFAEALNEEKHEGCDEDSCPIIFEEDGDGSKETEKTEGY